MVPAIAALDHIGGLVLVRIGTAEQFRRDVVEVQSTCRVGRKGVAAIEFSAHLGQAANENVRRFARWVRAVVVRLQAIDGDARQALERVGHRLVGERADVGRRDRIDERHGIFLDFPAKSPAPVSRDDDDFLDRGRLRGVICRAP